MTTTATPKTRDAAFHSKKCGSTARPLAAPYAISVANVGRADVAAAVWYFSAPETKPKEAARRSVAHPVGVDRGQKGNMPVS